MRKSQRAGTGYHNLETIFTTHSEHWWQPTFYIFTRFFSRRGSLLHYFLTQMDMVKQDSHDQPRLNLSTPVIWERMERSDLEWLQGCEVWSARRRPSYAGVGFVTVAAFHVITGSDCPSIAPFTVARTRMACFCYENVGMWVRVASCRLLHKKWQRRKMK